MELKDVFSEIDSVDVIAEKNRFTKKLISIETFYIPASIRLYDGQTMNYFIFLIKFQLNLLYENVHLKTANKLLFVHRHLSWFKVIQFCIRTCAVICHYAL